MSEKNNSSDSPPAASVLDLTFSEEKSNNTESLFESIKHINEYGQEFWYARELQQALEYKRWDKFKSVIEKAIVSCESSGSNASDHFSQVGKMVELGSGAVRETDDYELSRYACYLIVQNGDPHKEMIMHNKKQ